MLAAASGTYPKEQLERAVVALVAGTRNQRRDAGMLIYHGRQSHHSAALLPLLADEYADVRASAVACLAARAASITDTDDLVALAGLERAMSDRGVPVPLEVARCLSDIPVVNSRVAQLVEPLIEHPSALVRERASRLKYVNRW